MKKLVFAEFLGSKEKQSEKGNRYFSVQARERRVRTDFSGAQEETSEIVYLTSTVEVLRGPFLVEVDVSTYNGKVSYRILGIVDAKSLAQEVTNAQQQATQKAQEAAAKTDTPKKAKE